MDSLLTSWVFLKRLWMSSVHGLDWGEGEIDKGSRATCVLLSLIWYIFNSKYCAAAAMDDVTRGRAWFRTKWNSQSAGGNRSSALGNLHKISIKKCFSKFCPFSFRKRGDVRYISSVNCEKLLAKIIKKVWITLWHNLIIFFTYNVHLQTARSFQLSWNWMEN